MLFPAEIPREACRPLEIRREINDSRSEARFGWEKPGPARLLALEAKHIVDKCAVIGPQPVNDKRAHLVLAGRHLDNALASETAYEQFAGQRIDDVEPAILALLPFKVKAGLDGFCLQRFASKGHGGIIHSIAS